MTPPKKSPGRQAVFHDVFLGKRFKIVALKLESGECPVGDFLEQLDHDELRKLVTLFERLGDHGKISNPELFKKIEGSKVLFEFKRHQIRVFCCFHNSQVVLLDWVRKKRDKHRPADIQRAESLISTYLRD